jgi:hypothetical protein
VVVVGGNVVGGSVGGGVGGMVTGVVVATVVDVAASLVVTMFGRVTSLGDEFEPVEVHATNRTTPSRRRQPMNPAITRDVTDGTLVGPFSSTSRRRSPTAGGALR